MSGLGTIRRLREAGRQDLVVGVTGRPSSFSLSNNVSPFSPGNALLSDQKEYLNAGADQCVLPSPSIHIIYSLTFQHPHKTSQGGQPQKHAGCRTASTV